MKNPKAKLRRRADRLWYQIGLKEKCELGGEAAVQLHHFFYKSQYGHLRYDLNNGISLCQRCHFRLHHSDPKLMTDKIIEKRGLKWYNKLKNKAQNRPKPSYQNIKYYKDIIQQLNENRG